MTSKKIIIQTNKRSNHLEEPFKIKKLIIVQVEQEIKNVLIFQIKTSKTSAKWKLMLYKL